MGRGRKDNLILKNESHPRKFHDMRLFHIWPNLPKYKILPSHYHDRIGKISQLRLLSGSDFSLWEGIGALYPQFNFPSQGKWDIYYDWCPRSTLLCSCQCQIGKIWFVSPFCSEVKCTLYFRTRTRRCRANRLCCQRRTTWWSITCTHSQSRMGSW